MQQLGCKSHSAVRVAAKQQSRKAAKCSMQASNAMQWQQPASENLAAFAFRKQSPSLSLSPHRQLAAWISPGPVHPPITELARAERKLAGIRVDPEEFCRSRIGHSSSISFQPFDAPSFTGPYDLISTVVLPVNTAEDPRLNFISFSPDGKRVAFAVRDSTSASKRSPASLFVADMCDVDGAGSDVHAREVLPSQLNAVFENYTWVDEDTLLASVVPQASLQQGEPEAPSAAPGPSVQANSQGEVAVNVTYADLLQTEYDCQLFEHFATAELALIRVSKERSGEVVARSSPKLYSHVEVSSDGNWLLVDYMTRPFSYLVPCGRFPKKTELWRAHDLSFVTTIGDSPLLEHIPSRRDATRPGRRGISWRPDHPATIYWMFAEDKGDPDIEVSYRDTVHQITADDAAAGASSSELTRTEQRFSGLLFGREDLALLYSGSNNARQQTCWRIRPDVTTNAQDDEIFTLSYDDAYGSPGRPVSRRHWKYGTYLLATVDDEEQGECLLWQGAGATPEGQRPFMDLRRVEDLHQTKRIWRLDKNAERFEAPGLMLAAPSQQQLAMKNNLQLLSSYETPRNNPQLSIFELKPSASEDEQDAEAAEGFSVARKQCTNFPHPHEHLVEPRKDIIFYERDDGCQLNGTLFAPPGHDFETMGPLPCVLWAYPRELRSKSDAGQLNDSQQKFEPIPALSVLSLLSLGYCVLEGPAMPIIAENIEEEPNDTYIQQLTSSATAAVETLVQRGYAPRDRIACGGHSYGAAMAMNLAANKPGMFSCIIARSGAYNRTMTPFGFQNERRTLWEARETYLAMSPFVHADKMSKDANVLILHGAEDNNPGTYPEQSRRMYAALKAFGVNSRLVELPHESHGYRSMEATLHVQYETEQWLKQYL